MIEDLAPIIEDLATGTYQVRRQSAAVYQKGRHISGGTSPETSFIITALIIPYAQGGAVGTSVMRLPQGTATQEDRLCFTRTELSAGGDGESGDVVEADGDDWEVQSVQRWKEVANFFIAVLRRRGR